MIILVPVGPGDREVGRLRALLAGVRRHEDISGLRLIFIDDHPVPRPLEEHWPGALVLRNPLADRRRPDHHSAMVAGVLHGLQACEPDVVLKLDTDAAVIGPFADAVSAALIDEHIGIVGSYDTTSFGIPRDWEFWREVLDRASNPVGALNGRRLTRRRVAQRAAVSDLREAAYRKAPPGAHCLGGAYAVSPHFLRRAALDWRPWHETNLPDDVVVGLLCSAAGLAMQSLTRPGEPFALAWRGLPGAPADIAAAGYSIVHSVKAADAPTEAALRASLDPMQEIPDVVGMLTGGQA